MRLILRRIITWALAPTPAERAALEARGFRFGGAQKPIKPEWELALERLEASRRAVAPAGGAPAPDFRPLPGSGDGMPSPRPPAGPTP